MACPTSAMDLPLHRTLASWPNTVETLFPSSRAGVSNTGSSDPYELKAAINHFAAEINVGWIDLGFRKLCRPRMLALSRQHRESETPAGGVAIQGWASARHNPYPILLIEVKTTCNLRMYVISGSVISSQRHPRMGVTSSKRNEGESNASGDRGYFFRTTEPDVGSRGRRSEISAARDLYLTRC
jgi:hypothetical protein